MSYPQDLVYPQSSPTVFGTRKKGIELMALEVLSTGLSQVEFLDLVDFGMYRTFTPPMCVLMYLIRIKF